jgi:thiamine kinase-like enzyme
LASGLAQDVPREIHVLKETRKSAVYRLPGFGPKDTGIVVKRRANRDSLLHEGFIYEKILPHLPVPNLRCYGIFDEPGTDCSWLMLEDAGSGLYRPEDECHRILAGQWLAVLHASASDVPAAPELPARGSGWYLEHLRSARDAILRSLDNQGSLAPGDVLLLQSIVGQLSAIERRWSKIDECCGHGWHTIAHGDFVPKNIAVRQADSVTSLLVFDWEMAGWGSPAADLSSADVESYYKTIRNFRSDINLNDLEVLARIGRLFRLIASISWASRSLAYQWKGRAIASLHRYDAALSCFSREHEISGPRSNRAGAVRPLEGSRR